MSKLHRKKVTTGRGGGGFPVDLPDSAEVQYITERSGSSPVYVYYTKPDTESFTLEPETDEAAREAILAYADSTDDDVVAADLREWIDQLEADDDRGESQ
jgi:hypothetical protein